MKIKDVAIILLSLSLLLISSALVYYFIFYIPKRDKEKLENTRLVEEMKIKEGQQRKSDREKDLNFCLYNAEQSMHSFWESECEAKGLKKDCLLPEFNAERADKLLKDKNDECFKKYPQ